MPAGARGVSAPAVDLDRARELWQRRGALTVDERAELDKLAGRLLVERPLASREAREIREIVTLYGGHWATDRRVERFFDGLIA